MLTRSPHLTVEGWRRRWAEPPNRSPRRRYRPVLHDRRRRWTLSSSRSTRGLQPAGKGPGRPLHRTTLQGRPRGERRPSLRTSHHHGGRHTPRRGKAEVHQAHGTTLAAGARRPDLTNNPVNPTPTARPSRSHSKLWALRQYRVSLGARTVPSLVESPTFSTPLIHSSIHITRAEVLRTPELYCTVVHSALWTRGERRFHVKHRRGEEVVRIDGWPVRLSDELRESRHGTHRQPGPGG